MGRIPTYRAREIPRVTEPAVPPFSTQAIAEIRNLAAHLETRRMQDNLLRAREAETALLDWQDGYLDPAQSGLLARQGDAAKGSIAAFQAAAEGRYLELGDSLENADQRDLFRARSRPLLQSGFARVAAHEAVETELHRRSAMADAALAESRRALDLTEQGDAAAANEALQTAAGFLGQSLDGAPQGHKDKARHLLISGYHSAVFSRLLGRDPDRAGQYLNDNLPAIDEAQYRQLEQQAERARDQQRGRALHEQTYRADVSAADQQALIEASGATPRARQIARQLSEDRRLLDQAENRAEERQQSANQEQSVRAAVAWLDAGGEFSDLPMSFTDGLPAEVRTALRTVHLQHLTGTAAPYDAALETDLHSGWMRAIAGEDLAFLERSLTAHLGSHSRERLTVWMQRQDALTSADPEPRQQLARRRLSYGLADGIIRRRAEQLTADADSTDRFRARLNEDAISWIDQWHDAHPDRVLEPAQLLQTLDALAAVTGATMAEIPSG